MMTVDPEELAELEAEREFLLRSLADLDREHEAGDLDDSDYRELRDGYTARTAAILRTLESGRSQPVSATRVRPMWQKITASVLVLSFAVGAGLFVSRSAGTRLPNGSLTGNISSSVATLLAEARALQGTQPDEAVKRYIDVLKVDPDNVEALTYRGWILRILGDSNQLPAFVEEGRASLDRAIAVDPTYPDARVFRGILAYRNDNDAKAAIAQFDAFFALEQPPAQFVQMVLGVDTEARASLGLPAREASPASATASTTAP